MPTSTIRFEYFLARPYPWRFTTWSVFVGSTLVALGLLYFNLATVGLTAVPVFSSRFEASKAPIWLDRMNINRYLNSTIDCTPVILMPGGVYRAPGNGFTYVIQILLNQDSGEYLPAVAYSGAALQQCWITKIFVLVNYPNYQAEIEISVVCGLKGNLRIIATTTYPVSIRSVFGFLGSYGPRNSTSGAIELLISYFENDVLAHFLSHSPKTSLGLPATTAFFQVPVQPEISVERGNVSFSAQDLWERVDSPETHFNAGSIGILQNLILVLSSAVLFDLGSADSNNLLTNTTLWNQSLYDSPPLTNKMGYVRDNMDRFNLPYENTGPVSLNTRYLCQSMRWKAPANLLVDVLVATISLFMAYWGILQCVLRYFATRSSPKDSFCAGCEELLRGTSSTPEKKQLRFVDADSSYESLPGLAQSVHKSEGAFRN